MLPSSLTLDDKAPAGFTPSRASPRAVHADEARLRAMRHEHYEFLWRSVRRLGVSEADTDDAVQRVFIVAAGKLDAIPVDRERSFLFAAALRVTSHVRRSRRRRSEVPDDLAHMPDGAPSAEDLIEQRRARAILDDVLESLPMDVRAVFILFELEELTLAEIAALVGIPSGTAASRLRRGRELFQAEVARLKARRRSTL